MYNPDSALVTLEDIKKAQKVVNNSPFCVRTPLLKHAQANFEIDHSIDMYVKLENMQTTGSFKVRGVANQLELLPKGYGTPEKKLISMSAGNYGKAFAYMTNKKGLKGVILQPETAPMDRAEIMRSYGTEVERLPSVELQPTVDRYCQERHMLYLHSFDDVTLIAGHGSAGLEILEELPDPDVVLVCCGGGGFISGVAAAIKLSGRTDCRIYGVEPEGSCTMYKSYQTGKPESMIPKSVASGLSPPFAGSNAFRHCKSFVEDILLVSDEEILSAVFKLYHTGLLVEPAGAAAFAALYFGKVPDVKGKKVVVFITGGNMSPQELYEHAQKRC